VVCPHDGHIPVHIDRVVLELSAELDGFEKIFIWLGHRVNPDHGRFFVPFGDGIRRKQRPDLGKVGTVQAALVALDNRLDPLLHGGHVNVLRVAEGPGRSAVLALVTVVFRIGKPD
jgi:hypothetical protein